LLNDSNYPTDKQPEVICRYLVGGTPQPWVRDVFTKTSAGHYQEYYLNFNANAGENIVIQAVVNPVYDPVDNLMMDANGNPAYYYTLGYRLIKEDSAAVSTKYDNNYDYRSFTVGGTPPASENRYLYLGVYPATEGFKALKDVNNGRGIIVEVNASFKPTGNRTFTEVSWNTPSNSIGRPTGEPEISVKPIPVVKPASMPAGIDSLKSVDNFKLTPPGNFLDTVTYADLLQTIFGSDKNATQSLSCQTDSENVSSLGTQPDHDHDVGEDEGGCYNTGDGPSSPTSPQNPPIIN